jgi:Sulfotransferase family
MSTDDAATDAGLSARPARPLWIDAVNETAAALGEERLIPIDRASIIGDTPLTAQSSEALDALLRSLREEAGLTAIGLLFARIELLRAARARSVLARAARSPSAVRMTPRPAVVFIAGFARCGTSALQRALAAQEGFHAPLTAHVLYPEAIGDPMDRWAPSVTLQDKLWDLADPHFRELHVNRGDLPAECLPILSAAFTSNHWTGCYRVPSYAGYLRGADMTEAFSLHRMFALLLASASKARCLVFKAPTHVLHLPEILTAYPSARIVVMDRDAGPSLTSHWRLLRSIRSMRAVDINDVLDLHDAVEYFQSAYDALSAALQSGLLGADNLRVVSSESLRDRPGRVLTELGEWLGTPATQVPLSGPGAAHGRNGRAQPQAAVPRRLLDSRRTMVAHAREAGVLHV